ncbi:hypothetical protein D3C72_1534770 [compost metagenome]
MHLAVAVEVDRPHEVRARLVLVDLLLQQQRVGAQVDKALAGDDAAHDLGHVLVQQRLAAGDGHHGRAALVHGLQAFRHGQALVQDGVRIVDLAAAGAGEVAAEQGFQHQGERIALLPGEVLASNIGANAGDLQKRNGQGVLPVRVRRCGSACRRLVGEARIALFGCLAGGLRQCCAGQFGRQAEFRVFHDAFHGRYLDRPESA